MAGQSDPILTQGQTDFSGGVNSVAVPTIASDNNPNGLAPNQLAWLVNATVRDGGITQRAGWKNKSRASAPSGIAANLLANSGYVFEAAEFYEPDEGNLYIMAVIGGSIIQIDPDFSYPPVNLSNRFGLYFPDGSNKAYFVQAEQFMVIQAGDGVTLPFFWDGENLRQSNGITGTLTRGTPQPATFQITVTQSWTILANGNVSALIPLAAPYPGHLGDNLILTTTAGANVGTFRVVGVTPTGIYLLSVGVTAGLQGPPVPITYVCQYTTPGSVGNSAEPVILSNAFWNIPAVGKNGTVQLTTLYFGSVGDTVEITDLNYPALGSKDYGSFTVVSFDAAFNLTLKCNSSAYGGQNISQGDFLFTVTAFRSFSQSITPNGANGAAPTFTIPAVKGTIQVFWPAFDVGYKGSVFDIVSLTVQGNVAIGLFRVTAKDIYFDGDHAYPYIILETISVTNTAYIGVAYAKFTLAVVQSPYSPEVVAFNAGSWTIPDVGSSVSIQLVYEGSTLSPALGPAYPGNVGDTITLTHVLPAYQIGTFLVTAFDANGAITLKTISTNYASTVFTGANTAELAITDLPSTTGTSINEIPAALQMIYYMGRIFYNDDNVTNAGDIVGGYSGTSAYNYLDSVLCVTENPLVLGGDGFTLPTQSGEITGYAEPNTIDASLGQGLLLIGTRKAIYAMSVPITREDWISADSSHQPQIVEVQFDAGWVSDTAKVLINGDVYYMTWKKDIRSLIQATRLFSEPGNTPLSAEESRILQFSNASLLSYASAINFDNRLLMTALPMQTPYGVVHQAMLPLDFTPISSASAKSPACWEGHQEGLQIFQLLEQDFNGVDRAFAITLSENPALPGAIELWELTEDDQFENEGETSESRVSWQVEFPALEWGDVTQLKKLVSAELWVDRIFGTVEFLAEWRTDGQTCWNTWAKWKVCSARNANESPGVPVAYPTEYGEGYRQTMSLPKPPETCVQGSERPGNIGYQFQTRLTITGFCRIRGWWLNAELQNRKLYQNMICSIKDFVSNLLKW